MIVKCPVKLCPNGYREDIAVSVLATGGDGPKASAMLTCGCTTTREAWEKAAEPAREAQRQHDRERADLRHAAEVEERFAHLAEVATRDEILAMVEAMPETDDREPEKV